MYPRGLSQGQWWRPTESLAARGEGTWAWARLLSRKHLQVLQNYMWKKKRKKTLQRENFSIGNFSSLTQASSKAETLKLAASRSKLGITQNNLRKTQLGTVQAELCWLHTTATQTACFSSLSLKPCIDEDTSLSIFHHSWKTSRLQQIPQSALYYQKCSLLSSLFLLPSQAAHSDGFTHL